MHVIDSLRYLLLLTFALLTGAVSASEPAAFPSGVALGTRSLGQYKIDGWQTEQGLPLNTVQALLQTRDGALWVGTAGGLARFDGSRFSRFDPEQAPEMASAPVFGFLEDRERRLWIGHSSGAAVYRDGRFEPVIDRQITEGRRVWSFAQASDGSVWAATENGLAHWRQGQIKLYQQADGLPTNRLRTLAFDRAGVLWIGTSGGGLVSMSDGRFTVLNPDHGFPGLQVRAVLADPDGSLWAATDDAGLLHLDRGRITRYGAAEGLPTDHLTALARDAQGSLWVGSWGGGISRLRDGRFETLSSADGLAGNQIWSLLVDREGTLWAGTWVGGLNRLRTRPFLALGSPEGLSHDNVRAVLHARNGVSWVATAGGGLNRIEAGRITRLGRKDGLPSEEISALHEDREGALWIGSYTAGVTRLAQGRAEVFGVAQGLPGAEVRAIDQDRQGRIWVGTRSGLARFDGQRFVAVHEPGLPEEGVSAILQDRSGTLWFGTTGQGLVRLRDGRFSTLGTADGLVSEWIMALYEDASGSLWIGTNGEGMNRLRDGRLVGIRPADGLWDGLAQTILEDRLGYLWMSCNRGFYRVARAELDAFAEGRVAKVSTAGFGPADALRATTFAGGLQPAGAVDAGGRLWLPSAGGVVIVDPTHLPGLGTPPDVRLDQVLVNGQARPGSGGVSLPAGALPLSIRYAATTLLDADRVRFRYRMEGLTPDWVEVGASREASFPALPHGRYRFQVAASTDGIHWSATPGDLPISVKPFYYQTSWFLALSLLGGGAVVVALTGLRTRSLRRRQLEMEGLVAQRTEELRQANEHLSRLSYVDALTGLPNRRRFNEAIEDAWRRARRNHAPLALVLADVDAFKAYNDLMGHLQGDRCLAAVAAVFANAVGRAGDLAARYGGEEFVVLIPDADQAAALRVAEEMRAACVALALPHPAAAAGGVITISLGVASCVPGEGDTAETLFARADAALYRAKQEGRNRVC